LVQVDGTDGLADFVSAMIADAERRRNMGEQAAGSVQRYADLPARSAEALLSLLPAR
jgi:hypothetical protein